MQILFRFLLLCVMLFATCTAFGQDDSKSIKGRVKSHSNDIANVLIINLNSKKSTITDSLGLFTIAAKLEDSLRFTAVQYVTKEIQVTHEVFIKNLLEVNLEDKIINLNEVTVRPYNLTGQIDKDIKGLEIEPFITSSKLNLPNADITKLTQSERLLIEADRGKYVYYYGIALIINTHKIMNRISGRTKSYEDMVTRDENIAIEREIIARFSKKTISEAFEIPETKIDGFLTYCLVQDDFSELSEKTTTEIWEYLKRKSIEFRETD